MEFKIIVIFAVLAVTSSNVLDTEKSNNGIYNSIIAGNYDQAIEASKYVVANDTNFIYVIGEAVAKLLHNGEPNLINFAYKLSLAGELDILQNFFPNGYWVILDNKEFNFINKHHNLYLTLSKDANNQGKRTAYADKDDKNTWKLIPIWENNKVHFKIFNNEHNEYLQMGDILTDNNREVFSTVDATDANSQWFIQGAYYDKEVMFYVYNKEYRQALKISKDEKSNEDYMIYGGDVDVLKEPEYFGWFIEAI